MFASARGKCSATLQSAVLILALAKYNSHASLSLPTKMEVIDTQEGTTGWVLRTWSAPEEVRFRTEKQIFWKEELKDRNKKRRTRNAGDSLSCALYAWWRDWMMNCKQMQGFFFLYEDFKNILPYWYFLQPELVQVNKIWSLTKECI